ncbi:hypothetical protein T09_995 [Trichinella sp. T9]|nr:hypothetical protein T09_995 [Trichinella sp. T9]
MDYNIAIKELCRYRLFACLLKLAWGQICSMACGTWQFGLAFRFFNCGIDENLYVEILYMITLVCIIKWKIHVVLRITNGKKKLDFVLYFHRVHSAVLLISKNYCMIYLLVMAINLVCLEVKSVWKSQLLPSLAYVQLLPVGIDAFPGRLHVAWHMTRNVSSYSSVFHDFSGVLEGNMQIFLRPRATPQAMPQAFFQKFSIFKNLAPGVARGYAPGHKKICIFPQATP